MRDALSFGLLSFTSLLTIIDPIAAAPIFLAVTEREETRKRRRTALKACAVALAALLVFAVAGSLIFAAFGITIDALRIAGGILFFVMAMPMILGSSHEEASGQKTADSDPAIVPLAIPLICGPGAISTVMVLMGQSSSIWHVTTFLVALGAAVAATGAVLLVAPAIVRVVGQSGINAITRIIGLIVCAIGIQFVIEGLRPVVIDILTAAQAGVH